QLANLFTVLPHDDTTEMMGLLPDESVRRITTILAAREAKASDLLSGEVVSFSKEAKVREVLEYIRRSGLEPHHLSYAYVVAPESKLLQGIVDLRELLLAGDAITLGEIMAFPVVSAEQDDTQEDLEQIFAKYHYRMIPVVDAQDRILGIIRYKDIMKTS
ncbi:MAG TPA: CBS domain-containing protein, partial [Candidatus Methylomirabilis sp.]